MGTTQSEMERSLVPKGEEREPGKVGLSIPWFLGRDSRNCKIRYRSTKSSVERGADSEGSCEGLGLWIGAAVSCRAAPKEWSAGRKEGTLTGPQGSRVEGPGRALGRASATRR